MRLLVAGVLCLSMGLLLSGNASAQSPAEGRAAIQQYGCLHCHSAPGLASTGERGCVGCHQRLATRPRRGLFAGPRVTHYLHTPDLTHVASRLTDAYLIRYLTDPHDARPRLEESMPRLPVSRHDARAIVSYLRSATPRPSVPTSPAPEPSRVDRGRDVFDQNGCAGCHAFGNHDPGYELPPAAVANLGDQITLAPNLRFVRERMDPDTALAWIRDPSSMDPGARMERPDLSAEDARAVRDFLFLGDPGRPARSTRSMSHDDLEVLSRPVRFADVRRIFGTSCIHCHAHTTNDATTAGLGFSGTALDLSSWEGIHAGAQLPDGSSHSILSPDESGVAPLLSRLLTRHQEASRDLVQLGRDHLRPAARRTPPESAVGMPLGLPPLGRRQLNLVHTWIEQGAPR